jgi:CheY-like chemotaxis protein
VSVASKDSRTTILVVEDVGEIRSSYRRALREKGYSVITAEDDEEAMERVECLHCGLPALILTDLQMPALDSLVRRARAHERLREVPIVVIVPHYPGSGHEGVRILENYEQLDVLLATRQSNV